MRNMRSAYFMRIAINIFLACFILNVSCGFVVGNVLTEHAEIERASKIYKQIRCLTCGNTYISESQSEFAISVRNQIDLLILAGNTDQEIMGYIKKLYGSDIEPKNEAPIYVASIIIITIIIFAVLLLYKHYFKV